MGALLEQLSTFSRRLLRKLRLPEQGSANGDPQFAHPPHGLILHFTADPSLVNVVRWFCHQESTSSAHFVVDRERLAIAEGLDDDLPEVQALGVTVVQMRPLEAEAAHATWANNWSYGIELVNVGEVRVRKGAFVQHLDGWRRPYVGVAPVCVGARYFQPYTDAQIQATYRLCRALAVHAPIMPAMVLGHEQVQGVDTRGCGGHDKRDPSGLLDLAALRRAVFNTAEEAPQPNAFTNQTPEARDLQRLGYHVIPDGRPMDENMTRSLLTFQKLVGLRADGLFGPKSRAALKARLQDRFVTPPTLDQPSGQRQIG